MEADVVTVVYHYEDGLWWFEFPDVPELSGGGNTFKEAQARANERARKLIMAGGGLQAEHIPWLVRAGVRAFHIGAAARPLGSNKAYVDPDLVRTWRTLIDDAVQRAEA